MSGSREYTERDILSLLRDKDSSAMRLLYDRYIGYMAAVCCRYIPNENNRKDVLQESFIKILTSIESFSYRGEGSLKSWITRITANESLNFIRKEAARTLIGYEDELPDVPDEPAVESIPDDVISQMILELPPGYRMVFNLYVFENKSHKEIARLLGIKESTSASQFLRAKAALAKMIREYKHNESKYQSHGRAMDKRPQDAL